MTRLNDPMPEGTPDRHTLWSGVRAVAGDPRAAATIVALVVVVAWLAHVWIVATSYGGSRDVLPAGELVAGEGNRVLGAVGVLAWTTLLGVAVGLVVLGGWRRAGGVVAERVGHLRSAWVTAGPRGRGVGFAAGAVGGLLTVAARLASVGWVDAGDGLSGRDVSGALAFLIAVWLVSAATAPLGGRVARAVGTFVGSRLAAEPAGAVGSVVLSGAAAGLALLHLVGLPGLVLVVSLGGAGLAWWRLRTPASIAVLLVVIASVAAVWLARPAAADDGGWIECGASLAGYVGCDGTGAVYGDALWSVPAAAVGGFGGAALAAVLLARAPQPGGGRREPEPGSSTGVECRGRPDPRPHVVMRSEHTATGPTVALRPRRDPGEQRMWKERS
jgi:hypothetical protein